MTGSRILFVEDEEEQRRIVCRILRGAGYAVSQAPCAEEGLELLRRSPVDLVISDWKLPGRDGMELMGEVLRDFAGTAFILATAYGSISHAVEAVRRGADDYLVKPFQRDALLLAVERALRARLLIEENRLLSQALEDRERLVDLVGKAPIMQRIFRRLQKVASTDATVLITGESGTGKELAARALHSLSHRHRAPFTVIDCAAIPEGLVESELFGAEKGAYTGSDRRRSGKFEAASGGTLFLDEIGELPLPLQPKLLRVLQEGRFTRVGGIEPVDADVRIVAATNRDLSAEVIGGCFRQDLYYRLNVIPVAMPPLRERREDIPLLIDHFIQAFSRKHGIHLEKPPADVMRRLVDYSWPGNVRELSNVLERLVLLSEEGRVHPEDLPAGTGAVGDQGFRLPPGGVNWPEHERDCLDQALRQAGGNRAEAARLLGLPYKAFLYRLEKFGLVDGS